MLLTLALAAALAPPPHTQATLKLPSRPVVSGRTVVGTLVVHPAARIRPIVVARRPGTTPRRFDTKRVGEGRYRVRLRFSTTGRWRLSARVVRKELSLRSVVVRPVPPPTSPLPGATAFR